MRLEYSESGQILGDCTCPYAEEGNFCKHCVTLGIAFLKGEDEILSSSHPAELDAVRAYLQQCPHEELVDLLLEQATYDEDLLDRILLDIEPIADQI